MVSDRPERMLGPLAMGLQQRRRSSAAVYNTSGSAYAHAENQTKATVEAPQLCKTRPLGDCNVVPRQASFHPPLQRSSVQPTAATGVETTSSCGELSWKAICAQGRAEADRKRGLQLPIDDRSELKQWLFRDIMQRQQHPLQPRNQSMSFSQQPHSAQGQQPAVHQPQSKQPQLQPQQLQPGQLPSHPPPRPQPQPHSQEPRTLFATPHQAPWQRPLSAGGAATGTTPSRSMARVSQPGGFDTTGFR